MFYCFLFVIVIELINWWVYWFGEELFGLIWENFEVGLLSKLVFFLKKFIYYICIVVYNGIINVILLNIYF